ncbi:MAG TPA: hypothetical protein VD996_16305 [Chitinophagaceae bacterium]|nr:hypothetical protein [Chitinophagaceae bacterium]
MKNAITFARSFAIAALIITASTATSFANDRNKEESAVELRFVGNLHNQPVYQLDINKANADEYFISFSDSYGTVLYSGNIKQSQKFMINTSEVGDQQLTVTITSRRTNQSLVYTIGRSHTVVEENVVKRVK